jgi:uncharacterized protein
MELLGYLAAIAIGISLGLIGGGGSILTVPVLVYLLGVEPVLATAYSLFVVGSTALVGAIPKWRQGLVDVRTALMFGAPSIVAVFATRRWFVPAIPTEVLRMGHWTLTKPVLLMVLFAVLMVAAAISMIRSTEPCATQATTRHLTWPQMLLIGVEGLVVGTLTGLVGAGGGFLIIPALVLLTRLPMKTAVGTSLLIIGLKSLIGFGGDIGQYSMDWRLLATVTTLAVGGIFAGHWLSHRVDGQRLKIAFGWFVLLMGLGILWKEMG